METPYFTAAEAAAYLRIQRRTLLRWVRDRKIPAHRLSGTRRCVWRFLRTELDAVLTGAVTLIPSSAGLAQGR